MTEEEFEYRMKMTSCGHRLVAFGLLLVLIGTILRWLG